MTFLEDLARELEERATAATQSVAFPVDAAGYLDRQCPKDRCLRGFKVLVADDDKFGDRAWCIYCGHDAEVSDFTTDAQRTHVEEVGRDFAEQLLHESHVAAASKQPVVRVYGNHRAGVTITERVSAPPPRTPRDLAPPEAWAVMRLERTCDACGCRFAGLGTTLFCPACGARSAAHTFEEALRRARECVESQATLERALGRDYAHDVMATIFETSVTSLVTAFESFCKESFSRLAPTAEAPRRTIFQKLRAGSELWSAHGGRRFESVLSEDEFADLARYFQQRHVLAHAGGIVDEDYVRLTGDRQYTVGQRLIVAGTDVARMVTLVEKLVRALAADLPA